ncbi:MAG TPA: serine/threonine-protein kinase [Steroidobacteraceae bacterium]|nr:serine/threonine-protein kinase [Steroidobacteraceae bacterium]
MRVGPGHAEWKAVEQHLDRLLDMDEMQWETYLSQLEDDAPTIVAALREMMADRRNLEAQGFLETSLVKAPDQERVGTQVGAYTITSLIGRGGMGKVWLAQRSDGRFEGKFALKFLETYSASPAALDRFRREGRLLARLTHPHIARLIDAGVTASGHPYLILEYVQGTRIDDYCATHALGVEARVRLILEVIGALAHAHSNLVIHRDIKPTNILVTEEGGAKLLDFGIAKLIGAEAGSDVDSPATRIEDVAFTPEYAAPEQILGEPPSTATDVYQMGVLMFALLTGRLPLGKENATRAERIKAALDEDPPRMSEMAPAAVRKPLRGDLDAIVAKALRKLPRERYGTAAALADDLKRYLQSEPVEARANLLTYRMQKFVRRYRGAVIGTAAAAIALIAAAAFALYQMREAQIQRDQSREQARRAELQAEFVTLMMSNVGDKPATAEQLLDAGYKLVTQHYTDDPIFRMSAMLNLSARYGDIGLTPKQYTLLRDADQIARGLKDWSMMSRAECGLAEAEIDLGHLDRAVSWIASAKLAMSHVSNQNPLYLEDCMEADADVTNARGNPTAATQIAEQALALLEHAGATHGLRYSDLLGNIADYYKGAGDTHKGFEFVERALTAAERNGLGDTDAAMTAVHNVASSLIGFGELKEACSREARLVDRLQATGRMVIPAIAVLNGTCLLRAGDASAALVWYDKGVSAAVAEQDRELEAYARLSRARALIVLARFDEAAAELDHAAGSQSKWDGLDDSREPLRIQIVRGELLLAEQRYAEAAQTLRPVMAAIRANSKSVGSLLASAVLDSAKAAFALGDYADAGRFAQEALTETRRKARNPDVSADVGEASLMLAKVQKALYDASAAHGAAHQAAVSLTASLGEDHPLTREALALE